MYASTIYNDYYFNPEKNMSVDSDEWWIVFAETLVGEAKAIPRDKNYLSSVYAWMNTVHRTLIPVQTAADEYCKRRDATDVHTGLKAHTNDECIRLRNALPKATTLCVTSSHTMGLHVEGSDVDISVLVSSDEAAACRSPLEALGYVLVGTKSAHTPATTYDSYEYANKGSGILFEVKVRNEKLSRPVLDLHRVMQLGSANSNTRCYAYAKAQLKRLGKTEAYDQLKKSIYEAYFHAVAGSFNELFASSS